MTKKELEKFEEEFDVFYEKCEKFVELFGWTPCSEWTRFEYPFFNLKGLVDHSKDLTQCPSCKKFSESCDWADPKKCDYCD